MPDESPYDQPNENPDQTPGEKKPLGDNLKQKLDELEVEKHLHQFVDEAEKVANEAVERAGALAHERRDDVAGWLDKATGTVNEKTKGQYADKVDKVRDGVLAGLDKLASRRRVGDPVAPIGAPGTETATDTATAPDPTATPGPTAQPDPAAQTDMGGPHPQDPLRPADPADPGEPADPAEPTDPPIS